MPEDTTTRSPEVWVRLHKLSPDPAGEFDAAYLHFCANARQDAQRPWLRDLWLSKAAWAKSTASWLRAPLPVSAALKDNPHD